MAVNILFGKYILLGFNKHQYLSFVETGLVKLGSEEEEKAR
jgi:hypothetical protein